MRQRLRLRATPSWCGPQQPTRAEPPAQLEARERRPTELDRPLMFLILGERADFSSELERRHAVTDTAFRQQTATTPKPCWAGPPGRGRESHPRPRGTEMYFGHNRVGRRINENDVPSRVRYYLVPNKPPSSSPAAPQSVAVLSRECIVAALVLPACRQAVARRPLGLHQSLGS